jgi:hypothetical protein
MTHINKRLIRLALVAGTAVVGLFIGEGVSPSRLTLTSTAEARIGRPLTPMSYAGVARRTTRRAAYVGAAGAAAVGAAAAAGYYGSGCYQEVDAYGRVYTRCP